MSRIRKFRAYMIWQIKNAVGLLSLPQSSQIYSLPVSGLLLAPQQPELCPLPPTSSNLTIR